MSYLVRTVDEHDAEDMLSIYAPFIRETAVTFEYDVPTTEEFSLRITRSLYDYPWLVCEYDSHVIAYAYAGKHRDRKAYQWSVEASVYVKEEFRKRGIAGKLYTALFALLKAQG